MARKRRIAVAGLNIRVDKHPAGTYESLLTAAFRLKQPVKYFGDQYVIISRLARESNGFSSVSGSIGRFTSIDFSKSWFDTVKFDEVDQDEIQELNIPETLKPNYTVFFFSFFPATHTLVFETHGNGDTLSPALFRKSFETLLNQAPLRNRYGDVTVSLIADKEKLQHILGLPHLRTLTITIQRPNADDTGSYEGIVQSRLKKTNGRRYVEQFDAVPGESLKPDEEMTTHSEVAMTNGKVEAVGNDAEGNPAKRSSLEHPKVQPLPYDPHEFTHRQAFDRVARTFTEKM